jgi:hypothetical protein
MISLAVKNTVVGRARKIKWVLAITTISVIGALPDSALAAIRYLTNGNGKRSGFAASVVRSQSCSRARRL